MMRKKENIPLLNAEKRNRILRNNREQIEAMLAQDSGYSAVSRKIFKSGATANVNAVRYYVKTRIYGPQGTAKGRKCVETVEGFGLGDIIIDMRRMGMAPTSIAARVNELYLANLTGSEIYGYLLQTKGCKWIRQTGRKAECGFEVFSEKIAEMTHSGFDADIIASALNSTYHINVTPEQVAAHIEACVPPFTNLERHRQEKAVVQNLFGDEISMLFSQKRSVKAVRSELSGMYGVNVCENVIRDIVLKDAIDNILGIAS